MHGMLALGLILAMSLMPLSSARAKPGGIPVDVELVLAVDVSYSMDPEEQYLQRQGYIDALRSPQVLDAIAKGINGKIAIVYLEWASNTLQRVVADWHVISDRASAEAFIAAIEAKPPQRLSRTSISGAIDKSVELLETNAFEGIRRVIDISGDGSNNQGRLVTEAREDALNRGITINGLPIVLNRGTERYRDVDDLEAYYSECVIGGPGAFVIAIRNRAQFADATRTKLILEVSGLTPGKSLPHDEKKWPKPFSPVIPAQAKDSKLTCTAGERIWQERWGN
jgi:hypothetical protein